MPTISATAAAAATPASSRRSSVVGRDRPRDRVGGWRAASTVERQRTLAGHVTALDWIIVAFALFAALSGWMQGFLVGAATLAGFALGLFAGGRLGSMLVAGGSSSPYAPLFS